MEVRRKRFICSFPDCEKCYNKEWKLNAHMCKHTGVKPFACEHHGCGKSFCTKYHLARHQISHTGERPFRCAVTGCTEAFTTNSNLQKHIGRIHSQEQKRPYVCDFDGCGLAFKKNKQLKSHRCEQHTQLPTQLPPHQCTFEGCRKRFTLPSKLKRHEKVHRGYPCEEESCSFTGKTWTEYTRHRKDSHRAVAECEQCGKTFRDSWFLQQHLRVHADTRLVLRCPREGCDRTFTTVFNLQSHTRSFHEELRPFVCPHDGCGKTFAMKQSLRRHSVAVHDPERRRIPKPRPKRTLASRLSGYKPKKKPPQDDSEPVSTSLPMSEDSRTGPPAPVELVSLLQDATLLYNQPLTTDL